jgi:hypothetical protein
MSSVLYNNNIVVPSRWTGSIVQAVRSFPRVCAGVRSNVHLEEGQTRVWAGARADRQT